MEANPRVAVRPYILYSLPMSRGSQAIRGGRGVRKAFAKVSAFLEQRTTARAVEPRTLRLTAYSAYWTYAGGVEAHLTCGFERKYLRLGRANKKGTANVFSKV